MAKTIEKIEKLLSWYQNNSTKANIYSLLEFQDKLALLSVTLAEITAHGKGEALGSYFDRKYSFSVNKMSFINGGESIGKSETMAESSIKEQRDKERQDIEYSEYLRLMLAQVNKVLSACQQRISFAKVEWETSQRMSGDNTKIIA